MLHAADQQRHPHHAVHDDHDDGEQRIAHQSRVGAAMPHDRRDCNDLDRRDGECQQQRPVGLAQMPREAFRVADDRQGREQHNREEPDQYRCQDQRVVEARENPVLEQSEGRYGAMLTSKNHSAPTSDAKPRRSQRFRSGCKDVLMRHAGFGLRKSLGFKSIGEGRRRLRAIRGGKQAEFDLSDALSRWALHCIELQPVAEDNLGPSARAATATRNGSRRMPS